jgi:hypothetical protein
MLVFVPSVLAEATVGATAVLTLVVIPLLAFE